MEFILEIIVQCFFEFFLQLIVEVLSECGFHSFKNRFGNKPLSNPWVASAVYLVLGLIIGAASVVIFRNSFIHSPTIRLANLFLTPILVGGCMALIGWFRRKREQELIRLDQFGYGFLFAFGMSLIRFIFANHS